VGVTTDQLKQYINWGFELTVGVAFALLGISRFADALAADRVAGSLSICLFVVTLLQWAWYARASREELDMLRSAFDQTGEAQASGHILLIAVGLAIAFGSLLATTTNLPVYAGLLVFFQILDTLGQAIVNQNILPFYDHHKAHSQAAILFRYYYGKPHMVRCALLLASYSCAFCLAVVAKTAREPAFAYGAYAIMIIAMPAGEWVIYRWRQVREAEMKPVERAARRAESVAKRDAR
jgi:hypothetical protein